MGALLDSMGCCAHPDAVPIWREYGSLALRDLDGVAWDGARLKLSPIDITSEWLTIAASLRAQGIRVRFGWLEHSTPQFRHYLDPGPRVVVRAATILLPFALWASECGLVCEYPTTATGHADRSQVRVALYRDLVICDL